MSKELNEICDKIANFSPVEIELRFLIDSRRSTDIPVKMHSPNEVKQIVEQLINKYSKQKHYIEQTINFISNDTIKQLVFVNGEQDKNKLTHYSKHSLIKPIYLTSDYAPAYKLSISTETQAEPFEVKLAQLARIKLRYSIEISDIWRLDITLVKQIMSLSNMSELVSARQRILTKLNIKNFLAEAAWDAIDHVEFELECINQKQFSADALRLADDIFEGTLAQKSAVNSDYQQIIFEVAKWIKPHMAKKFSKDLGMKSLGNQVIELDKNKYLKEVAQNIQDYYITDKVDGKRAIVYLSDKLYILTDTLTVQERPDKSDEIFIFDAELYDQGPQPIIYVFDVMVWESESQINQPFEKRLALFDKAKQFGLQLKPFVRLSEKYTAQIKQFKEKQKSAPYETDGLILTPYNGKYNDMTVYKYKPIEKLTIDFLIKKCPDKLLGTHVENIPNMHAYLLFCGISRQVYLKLKMKVIRYYDLIFQSIDQHNLPQYFPIQFEPADNRKACIFYSKQDDLDSQVGEFKRSKESIKQGLPGNAPISYNHFELLRLRTDRLVEVQRGNYFGNNYKIAETTWFSYYDPLVIEDTEISAGYFAVHDNPLQKASRSFNSYVKSVTLENYKDIDTVCDLACGKGQDLFRYGNSGLAHLYGAEIDATAISEFIQRKHEFSNDRQHKHMSINACLADLTDNPEVNLSKFISMGLPADGFKLVICNFAFHYFLGSNGSLRHLIGLLDKILAPGGRFLFTAFDGASIIRLLNENDLNWTVKVGDQTQYSIKVDNAKKILLEEIGQAIDVWLPFSSGYYREYLVNIDYVAIEFAKKGFSLEINEGFGEHLDAFNKDNYKVAQQLTKEDKEYVSLYHTYVFYKRNKKI